MAYDEYLVDRIRRILAEKKVPFTEKKMIGGLVFMVESKMLCGTHIDRKFGDSLLMARIGEEAYARESGKDEVLPMDFTGRPMKGYAFITPDGFDRDQDLEKWVQLCLDFNPMAKASKKRNPKKG